MRWISPALVLSALASLAAAQDPDAARVDRDSLLHHYATVEAELRRAPAPDDAATAARRLEVIDLLRVYRERADFGIDRSPNGRVPRFVDADGRRCAVAWMLDHTGNGDLTLAIQRDCNNAWVAELTGNEALRAWLDRHGLSAAEAARIQAPSHEGGSVQPPPPPPKEWPRWNPTDRDVVPPATGSGTSAGSSQRSSGSSALATAPTRSPARTTGARGVAIDSLANASWLDWWQWNRGVFELPATLPAAAAPSATASAQQQAVSALLTKLADAPDAAVRGAAVQALGRIGAPTDTLRVHLTDAARNVRMMTMLGLGGGRNAANAHALASMTTEPQQGETLAVVLAGIAVAGDGPARRVLSSALAPLLADQRPAVQTAAALAAGGSLNAGVRATARELLRSSDATPLRRAADAELLGPNATDDDVALLTALANDRNVDVRRSASLALGRSKHALALPALQSAFELEHEELTRAMQLLAIGDHGGDAGKDFLLVALERAGKSLRAHAALALGLWGHGRGNTYDLAERVANAFADEHNSDQKGAYLLALGMLRDPGSRELLQDTLLHGPTSSMRGSAAAALGMLGDRAALPALGQALASDTCPGARQTIARAIGRLGRDAIDALVAAMRGDKDAGVQREAAWSLGGIQDARATAALLEFAADESAPAVARAGAALGLGRCCRRSEPQLPALRFQRNYTLLPPIAAWAFNQEL
jgi:HEAT repeat protein